jgi:hypothetical protein
MTEADEVVWHDLEHCGYRADLPVWRSIAGRAGPSSTVELGAGSGRGEPAIEQALQARLIGVGLQFSGQAAAAQQFQQFGLGF